MLFYFSLLFVKFFDKHRIFHNFSNLTLDFYNSVWKYSWRFQILGMLSIHIIPGPHATGIYGSIKYTYYKRRKINTLYFSKVRIKTIFFPLIHFKNKSELEIQGDQSPLPPCGRLCIIVKKCGFYLKFFILIYFFLDSVKGLLV